MEMSKVPAAGYKITGLWISGLQRSLSLKNLMFPFKVLVSLRKSAGILKSFKPDIAVGTGGYASGPLLFMAQRKGIPTLIQEQNSYPGITNKLLGKKVDKICVASDGLQSYFPKDKIVLTGNPVRQDLISNKHSVDQACAHFNLDSSRKTLLVLGGSLGARRINELIATHQEMLQDQVNILWQCGKYYIDTYNEKSSQHTKVLAFIDRMDLAFTAADFIISRAGAGTISELALAGKPVIFIPSPHVAEDHQTKNAQAVAQQQAAIMIKEAHLSQQFVPQWQQLLSSKELQSDLSTNIQKLARPDATAHIVNYIQELINV
jgi:UDP-N-acetylglucosamine--N-acetylmuramyl-(pentapeptide) pyrophosphoryl-undecaprenol N-acetylglucosamine transferase